MSRLTIINIVLGVIAGTLVGILIWQETSEEAAPPATTTTTTTLPATTTSAAATTSTTTTTSTTSTTSTTTTTTTTPPPTSTEVLVERFFVAVVVANGTTAGELLDPAVQRIRSLGHVSVRGLNSQARVNETVLYAFDEEFRGEAEVLALDLGYDLDEVEIGLFEDAPRLSGLADARVIVFLGADGLPDPPAPDDADADADDG